MLAVQDPVVVVERRPVPALPPPTVVPPAATPLRTFDAFYEDHVEELRRAVSVALGDPDLGTEATDEAMVRALERWSQVGGYDNPAGWVYRVAVNYATSRLRRVARRVLRAEVPELATWTEPRDLELAEALGRLSDDHRTVVVARFQLDWTIDQIAEALEIAPGTVKSRLSRALDRLRTELEGGAP